MSRGGGSSGGAWFPWKTMCLILAILIYTLVAQDIQKHGTFESKSGGMFDRFICHMYDITCMFLESKTGIFLKDVGLDKYALSSYKYWSGKAQGLKEWGEETAPVVSAKLGEFRVASAPYVKKAQEAAWRAYAWSGETAWWAMQKVEEQLPGAQEKLLLLRAELIKWGSWLLERLVHYSLLVVKVVAEASLAAWKSAQDAFDRIAK